MEINLRCTGCRESFPTSYAQLYPIWRAGYESMPEELKEDVFVTAEIRCICGHQKKWDSPMFKYLFGTMFQEFKSLED